MGAGRTPFLKLLERGVYATPGSPYLVLLEAAGIELGDLPTPSRTKSA